MIVSIPTWTWAVPLVLAMAGTVGWAGHVLLDATLGRLESWVLRRWSR